MKKLLLMVLWALPVMPCVAQQTISSSDTDADDDKRAYMSATGGTDALNFETVHASGGITLGALLSKELQLNIYSSFNFSGEIQKDKSDSLKITSIFFPDIGTSAFLGGFEFSAINLYKRLKKQEIDVSSSAMNDKTDILIAGELSLQKRNIEYRTDDTSASQVYPINIQNFNLGVRARFRHFNASANNKLIVTGTYYPLNRIVITRESEKTFTDIFANTYEDNKRVPTKFTGFSFLLSFEFSDAMVYLRTFGNYENLSDFYFTVGIKATGKFISF